MKLPLMASSLFYFVTLMFMQNHRSCNGCLENERIGLLKIKDYIMSQKEGDPDNELGSWIDDRDNNCCTWNRVKCFNISFGHITHLSLGSLHFLSSDTMLINASLFRPFEELCFLDLSYIGFRGWMGNKGFPRLKKLKTLDLTYNYLNSSILPSLNGLHALKTLKLGSNLMNYFSAQGFPRLKKLETLDLSINNLNSSILSSLNGLTALKNLKLGSNFMNYFSAQGFLRTKELEILELSGNFLNCSTLPSLHGFTSLRSLMLSQNNFDCSFSALDFSKFSRLELLDLSNNRLIGSLHVEEVQNLRNLKMISLRNNHMNGSIEGLCKLKYLEELDISYNMFIVSLDLVNESYEEVLMPDYGEGDITTLQLSIFRYSLCLISGEDVWIMNEYGNKKSWTKLFTISLMGGPPRPPYRCVKTIHVFENDQVLLRYLIGFEWKFTVYNCKNGTSKFTVSGDNFIVYLESLISPYSIS